MHFQHRRELRASLGNQQLKQQRGYPHVLLPGDQVFTPPIESGECDRPTNGRHKFLRKGVPIQFELKVLNGDEPRKGEPYQLSIEGRLSEGNVPDNGILKLSIRPSDRKGLLILRPGASVHELGFAKPTRVRLPYGL